MEFCRCETGGEAPSKRAAHSLLVHDKAIWVFGGNCDLQFYNDMYYYSLSEAVWKQVTYTNESADSNNVPSPRAGHSMESYDNFVVVFGGGNRTQFFGELYFFDVVNSKWELKIPKVLILTSTNRAEDLRNVPVILQSRFHLHNAAYLEVEI